MRKKVSSKPKKELIPTHGRDKLSGERKNYPKKLSVT